MGALDFVYGDTEHVLEVQLKDAAGAILDLTGADVYLDVLTSGTGAAVTTVSGVIASELDGLATFAVATTAALAPANAGQRINYLGLVRVVNGSDVQHFGAGGQDTPFAFTVTLWQ